MTNRFLPVLGLLLACNATPFAALPAAAQTSFSANQSTPTDIQGWQDQAERHVIKALRRADSTLNRAGNALAVRAVLAVTIMPDGRVAQVTVVESSGWKPLDDAYIRSFSRIEDMPPFTPDMPQKPMTLLIPLKTGRG